jgi:hypothetical protein
VKGYFLVGIKDIFASQILNYDLIHNFHAIEKRGEFFVHPYWQNQTRFNMSTQIRWNPERYRFFGWILVMGIGVQALKFSKFL